PVPEQPEVATYLQPRLRTGRLRSQHASTNGQPAMFIPATNECELLDHPPTRELDRPAAIGGIAVRVGHLNDRCSLLVQPGEQLHDLVSLTRMQVAGWLIGQDQFRRC